MVLATVCASTTDARADWLFTPFLGGTFASGTTFFIPELRGDLPKHVILGGSGAWLTRDRILGGEADFSYAPHFFETNDPNGLVFSSSVATFTINLIAAAPLSLTRESLRPYLVGGAGVIHAGIEDLPGFFTVHDSLAGMTLGGGVIGFVSQRTGLRFDLRKFRSFSRSADQVTLVRGDRLSFWRATVGVTLRY
jgi:hypothetical protein